MLLKSKIDLNCLKNFEKQSLINLECKCVNIAEALSDFTIKNNKTFRSKLENFKQTYKAILKSVILNVKNICITN